MYKVVVFAAITAAVSASSAIGNSNTNSFDSIYSKQALLNEIKSELNQQQEAMLIDISGSITQKYLIKNQLLFSSLSINNGQHPLNDEK
ncbi:hypothetical protein D5R81_01685 [Parashewanella spongiae]|uniref:Uncharacterized protein n=1 Tax=Parashewanella spongiae TaxID=342950 RepID=A0A3A6U1A0_9GAMM|nr:hypothetical protein [Parashewanella spongiae]MCL1076842.1 hypothetical protein [Parashewanella spongiae]RJY19210.1 hypothetical protein D5R81_01685 [Parashewanella spongiae]